MSEVHSGFDRRIFKFATAVLLLCMILRHAMFYLGFGRINTEMGFDQSWFGVLLLPVTASFGCIFFWERSQTQLKQVDFIRLVLIGVLPVLLALRLHDVQSVFTYTIETIARRPSFLILIPIALSVLLSHVFKLSLISLIPIGVVNYFVGDVFVVHYASIFLTFAVLQTIPQFRKYQKSFVSAVIFLCGVFVVEIFEVKRIGFVLELLLAVGFVGSIFYCSSWTKSLAGIVSSNKFIDQLSVFYFYLFQAIAFTIAAQFKSQVSVWIFIPLIFFTSLAAAFYLRKAESSLIKVFSSRSHDQ